MAPAMPVAVELTHLYKRFDRFEAVRDISLTIAQGELFGLLGPNGAGKTTTLLMLAGMLRPSAGSITIFGVDVTANPVAAKQQAAFIPDRPYVYDKLTGRELLHFTDEIFGCDERSRGQRAAALLERFDLTRFADELIEGYSHGMKQRLVFACALVHAPRLLVVDEPMVGLDPQGARLVKGIFREICAAGGTVILSTHTMQVAEQVCDRVAIIDHGIIAAQGTVVQLRDVVRLASGDLEDVFLALTAAGSDEVSSTGARETV
jgi:ABC-2 type transport system ATP-binding protein